MHSRHWSRIVLLVGIAGAVALAGAEAQGSPGGDVGTSSSSSGGPVFGTRPGTAGFRQDDPILQDRLPTGTDAEIADFIDQTSPALTKVEARFFKNSLHWLLQAELEKTPGDPAAARHAVYAKLRGLTYLQAMYAGYELHVRRAHVDFAAALKRRQANQAVLDHPATKPESRALAESNLRILERKVALLKKEWQDSQAEMHLMMDDTVWKTSSGSGTPPERVPVVVPLETPPPTLPSR